MPSRERARDRVLTDDEIKRIVAIGKAEPFPFGPFVLLLLATAQRRGELAELRWSQIDREAATWEIPGTIAKNGKPNVVPLSAFATCILDTVPRFDGCDLVFTTNRRTPVSGFSKMLKRISEAAHVVRLAAARSAPVPAATGMARSGVAPHVIEKVLNHLTGSYRPLRLSTINTDLRRRSARH